MDFEAANKLRDKRLRRRMLSVLYEARGHFAEGEYGARALVDLVNANAAEEERIEDESHALSLIADLEGRGYVAKRDTRTHKRQRFGLEFLRVKITARGVDLHDENAPVDPAVEDDRIG